MSAVTTMPLGPIRQHVIDPEICIRCNTCEETCPIGAVRHGDDNYVVDADVCNHCLKCVDPCPTGAIANWRLVPQAYSLQDQLGWMQLPVQTVNEERESAAPSATEVDVVPVVPAAPPSAARPVTNRYRRAQPLKATVHANQCLTSGDPQGEVHHVVLDAGAAPFPFLEGQSVGVVVPGADSTGRNHALRQYSIASSRHGEAPGSYRFALTVKRVPGGLGSNHVCDLKVGDTLEVTGPFGVTFLLPEDPAAHLVMVCTGTGVAPFRGFIQHRLRQGQPAERGAMLLFYGAQRAQGQPYLTELQALATAGLEAHVCHSRELDRPKTYVQDLMRAQGSRLAALLTDERTHLYVCGRKGMESGVNEALVDVCQAHGLDWGAMGARLRAAGRYQVETY